MNKCLIIAELFILKALRGRFLPALAIIFLPFLIAAWVFEVSNPGFQTTFAADAGSSLMWLFSALTVAFLASESFLWKDSENIPWFFLTRSGDVSHLITGNFAGLTAILFFVLILAATAFLLLFRVASGVWSFTLFAAAFMIFLELTVLAAVLVFLAAILSRVMAAGCMILLIFLGHSLESLRQAVDASGFPLLYPVTEFLLVLVPDLELFKFARFAGLQVSDLMIITLYAALMTAAYLSAAAIFMRRRSY